MVDWVLGEIVCEEAFNWIVTKEFNWEIIPSVAKIDIFAIRTNSGMIFFRLIFF